MYDHNSRLVLATAAVVVAAATPGAGAVGGSPTITFVAARSVSDRPAICAVSSSAAVRVVAPRGEYIGHRWHPRGTSIALVVRQRSTWALEVAAADGSHPRRLSTARWDRTIVPFGEPAWSPDGRLIAFIRDRSLFVVRPDGRGLRRLRHERGHLGWYSAPSWSASGDRIFVVHVTIGPVYVHLVSMRPDGTGGRWERGASEHLAYGSYSPDRTKVAWTGQDEVHLAEVDGGTMRTVVPSVPWPASYDDPVWSPDGSAIAYRRLGPGLAVEVFRADAESGVERRVTTNRLIEREVAWHPGRPRSYGRCSG